MNENGKKLVAEGFGNTRKRRINCMVAIAFTLILFCSIGLQIALNGNSAQQKCTIILNQFADVVTSNEQNVQVLTSTLKDDYIVRVRMLAQLLGNQKIRSLAVDDYIKYADEYEIDEIHIFDATGTIFNGTNPEYFGYSFDSGEQMAFFKPILKDQSISLCQDVTPNTAEGKPMMYAMTWNIDHCYLIQIGVSPSRLIKVLGENDLSQTVKRIPLVQGMAISIVDANTKELIGCTDGYGTGQDEEDVAFLSHLSDPDTRYSGRIRHHGAWYYVTGERQKDHYVLVYYQMNAANHNLTYVSVILLLALILAWLLIAVVTEHTIDALEENRVKLELAKEAAERASASKTRFLSRMTHDIRTPLNGIIGLLQIDEKHPDNMELLRSNHKKMKISADHLLSLINDVLQMSKLEDGNVELAHEVVDLRQLAVDVLTIVDQRAADAGVTLMYDADSGKLRYRYVYGSPLHLRQLFLNIFGNCVKYNHVSGKVITHFECVGETDGTVSYQWAISDTGVGMSHEFLEHIFEPFSQERSDARSVYKGTGLGMAIVKTMIDKMNGTIQISSTPGEGSTFVITIPFEIAPTPLNQPEEPDQKKNMHNIRGLRLLLAEDNELNAEIAEMLLRDEGALVTVARDGQQAIDLFEKSEAGSYDAILMDIMMPNVDGLQATQIIRNMKRPDAAVIPILALTANAFDEDARICRRAGMNDHISKPMKLDILSEKLTRYCRNSGSGEIIS